MSRSTERALRPWALVLAALAALAPAVLAAPFGEPGEMDPGVPTPESYLGYPLGARFTPHAKMMGYLQLLADASDRIILQHYGETEEGRPLVYLILSDPTNLANQVELRRSYARLADPRTLSPMDARAWSRTLPVAVWLSFNIHGDEPSSSEAAMALVYDIAATRDPETLDMLRHAVILVDPCLNPDGRERYVRWYSETIGDEPDPNPAAREHHEPWPGGRENHYLFDLNRDWAWLTQKETRARIRAYLSWHPQVHVDFHEMYPEETYFFFPPEPPVHALYPPSVMEWNRIFGRGNAAAFDARGWRYYTEESFDLYYPGYGDSWPTFHGAVGMTYEQAGHGLAGLAVALADGDTLTLAERAHHHYVAALATVKTAVENREKRLSDFYHFFADPVPGGPAAYLFPPGRDPDRTAQLVDLLMNHGAEVSVAGGELRPRGLHAYPGSPDARSLPAGTYVVPLDQPLHRFLEAILEPEAALPDTSFYDVSAWSLPLAFGIPAYWSDADPGKGLTLLKQPPHAEGTVETPGASYAFLVSWEQSGAPRLAARLLDRGIRVHFLSREAELAGERFCPGSLVVFRGDNGDSTAAILAGLARECRVRAVGVNSGLSEHGPDLGSEHVHLLRAPRVAVVADDPALPTSVGACWYLLERTVGVTSSLVRPRDLSAETLKGFTALVFPDDEEGGKGYSRVLGDDATEAIRTWVQEGGVFVGLGGGAFWADADQAGLSTVKSVPDTASAEEGAGGKGPDRARRLETVLQRERREQLESVPGTIFRVDVDPLQPLAYGYSGEARVFKETDLALELGPPGTNVAWFTDAPRVSGYVSSGNADRFSGRPFLVDEPVGKGHVVLYVEDPNFRLFWYGLTKMFLNGLFFLPSLVPR